MKKWSILIFLVAMILNGCGNNSIKIETDHLDTQTKEVTSSHVFTDGEHIFWSTKRVGDNIVFTVELAPTWKTYSQYNQNFMGPLPTIISFDSSDAFELVGSTEESMVKMKFDKEANEELAYFEGKGSFTQKIKINSGEKFVVSGNINYMTCNQHGCEPPTDYPFSIEVTP